MGVDTETNDKGEWGQFWKCWWNWLWWRLHGSASMSQPIKLYALSRCSLLYINCTSMKLQCKHVKLANKWGMCPAGRKFDMLAVMYKDKIESLHLEWFLTLYIDHPVSSILMFAITGHVPIACCSTLPPPCHLFTLSLWTPAQPPLSPPLKRILRAFLIIHWVSEQPFSCTL